MGIRGLARPLKEVARGRWWISRDCGDGGVMASFLPTATFSCTNIEHTDDAAEALVWENDEVPLFEYLRGRAKPLVGARQIGATGQAEDLPGIIGAYGESKEVLQGGASAT